jgi:hydroxymethylpyrimidine pyrophosphatase-like HAD family hydrolase
MRLLKPLVRVTGRDHITGEEFYHKLATNYIIHETGNYLQEHKEYTQQMPQYLILRAAEFMYCHVCE